MAIRKIVVDGDPVLRERAKEVDPKDIATPEFKTLLEDMVDTMYHANGVGIAAPQIGVSKRIFIAESAQGPIALINPVFTKKSLKSQGGEEGCLSVPGKFDKLRRHKTVTIEALTAGGEKISFTAENFFARILQHELDHLDGYLYIDRVKEAKNKE
ncbi:MAG TPA: peptide deformylase [Candidatus Eisenbacteria bacterium]|nr:peptide deformylase [Candidatus Eisenbacteria bacterium]